jgi:hypothetical protein
MPLAPPLSKLEQLKNKKSQQRERIFFHKLAYDLKVSAINSGQNLHFYEVEVDDAGYDIIVDDGFYNTRKFQLKTRLRPGGATKWKCHSQLFCPSPDQESGWQFPEWNCREAWGYDGGFILMDIEWLEGSEPKITYSYCDLSILMAIRDGFFNSDKKQEKASDVLRDTRKDQHKDIRKFKLPQTMLVKPKDSECMLSLMGFNTTLDTSENYNEGFINAYSQKRRRHHDKSNDQTYLRCFFKLIKNRII